MQVTGFLSNFIAKFAHPLKHKSSSNAHSHFYKYGFMTHEIEALQSTFHSKDKPKPK